MGLWKGLGPNIARNAIINAAELASYDQIKQSMLASGMFTVRCMCVLFEHVCSLYGGVTARLSPPCRGLNHTYHCPPHAACARPPLFTQHTRNTQQHTQHTQDNIVTHLVAGLGAGFFAVCVGSPVDVVKSRVMGEPRLPLQVLVCCVRFVQRCVREGSWGRVVGQPCRCRQELRRGWVAAAVAYCFPVASLLAQAVC